MLPPTWTLGWSLKVSCISLPLRFCSSFALFASNDSLSTSCLNYTISQLLKILRINLPQHFCYWDIYWCSGSSPDLQSSNVSVLYCTWFKIVMVHKKETNDSIQKILDLTHHDLHLKLHSSLSDWQALKWVRILCMK